MSFFDDQAKPVKVETLEDQNEGAVPRDRWDRPLILQADGSRKAYNRASSYGGNIEDKSNISKWQMQQVVRGIAMHPELLNAVPGEAKGDPWADLDRRTKTALTRIADQAQEYAGSNLKSALGTQIHAATEFVDMGDSLMDKFSDLPPERRRLLIERGDAYYRKTRDYGLTFDSIEVFGVQDELQVAGTWDRRGYVPWWPKHSQTTMDVKTSSSLDFAGVGFSVQLSTYAHMDAYDFQTGGRTPHEDMNLDQALIIHVDRQEGGPVTLATVDIEWGWRHAMLSRQILVARREGKGRVAEIDDREVMIASCATREDLLSLGGEIVTWPQHLRDLANAHYSTLAA